MSIKAGLILGYLVALILTMISIPVMLFLSYAGGAVMFLIGLFAMILTVSVLAAMPKEDVITE